MPLNSSPIARSSSSLDLTGRRAPLLVAAVLAGLVGWSVMAWVLKWPQPSPLPLATAVSEAPKTVDTALVARALGDSQAVEVQANAVLVLSGVVAASQGTQGAAVISINGQVGKPVRVGQAVNADWRLASVTAREAVLLSPQGARMTLSLPAPVK